MNHLADNIIYLSQQVIEFMLVNSIYSMTLALIVLMIKLLYSKLPQTIEYGLWCVVLIRLVLPNDLSFDYSFIQLVHPLINPIIETSKQLTINDSFALLEATENNFNLINYIFLSWLMIVTIIFLRYASLRFKLIKMINKSSPVVDYWPVRCANRWRLNFYIKDRVIIIAANKFLSPFTFSFVNPIIFIPKKILETNNEALIESIIAHEMAHIKRKDSLWLLLQNLIQIVYFFNPIIWLIVSHLSSLRENICDQMVLSVGKIKPKDYGKSLLQVLRFNISGDNQSLLPSKFLGHKNQIKKRISAIGNYQSDVQKFSLIKPIISFGFVTLFTIFLVPFGSKIEKPNKIQASQIEKNKIDESPFPEDEKKKLKLPFREKPVSFY